MAGEVSALTRETRGELACWHMRFGQYDAWVSEQGAQVLSFGRQGGEPIVWMSDQADYQAGVALRGGVPVCWPWFSELARNPESVRQAWQAKDGTAPQHGLVRTLSWEVAEARANDDAVHLELRLQKESRSWSHAVEPALVINLDATRLRIALTTRNTGTVSVPLTQALHTYFAVGDVRNSEVRGLDGAEYIDTVGGKWTRHAQQGPVLFEGETDRIYLGVPSRLQVLDGLGERRLCLETEGSRSAVVWNPHIEKASRLSHFAPDAWLSMLCVETANVMEDLLTLAPGQSHTLAVSLREEAL